MPQRAAGDFRSVSVVLMASGSCHIEQLRKTRNYTETGSFLPCNSASSVVLYFHNRPHTKIRAAMIAVGVLFALLCVAAWTDCRSHIIYNWNCYPGILAGLLLNTAGFGIRESGVDGLWFAAAGFLSCGMIMLTAFVFFRMGGGDVKLLAMIGSFLGLQSGIEALLWTFSIGFIFGVATIIWRYGFVSIVRRGLEHAVAVAKARSWIPLHRDERKPLEQGLFLAPSALIAVCVVVWPEVSIAFPSS
jgi:prepilin signal peptidase PulO-like enzyme (type II secretory pathway)